MDSIDWLTLAFLNRQCTHFDNSELEANYQAFKQSRRTVAPMSPSLQIPSSPAVSYSRGQCPNDMELFGVGSHTHGCPNQPIVNDHEHEHRDDDIVLDSPSTMVDTSRGDLFLSMQAAPININPAYSSAYSPTYIAPVGFDDLYTPFHNLYPGSPMLSSPGSSVGDEEKPLGLLANGTIWECKRGAIDPWTLARTDNGPHECHARFQNLNSLLNHYRTQHEPFFNDRMVHRCSCCGSFAGPYDQSCTKCTIDACLTCTATWPLASWYYGTMMPPAPSLISGTSTIHTGQGFRNGNGLLSLPSYFGGSNSYSTSPDGSNAYGSNSFGIYGGSSYAGSTSGQTFGTTSKGTAETRRFEHYAPLQHQVSSNHDPLRHHHDENSISVKPTREDRPREPPREPPSDYHHFPRKSPKCSAPPTTFSLMAKSANSLKLNAPCLTLTHYLILLLLFSFPSRSSDVDNTTSSSLIKEVVRSMGHYMPLVSALCIAVGVLGMWVYRFGSEAVEETTSKVVGDGRRSSLLSMSLVA